MQLVFTSRAEQKALHVRINMQQIASKIELYTQFICNTINFLLCIFLHATIDLLIDISDVLQICCYELGRTYLKLSQALCINLPSIGEYTYDYLIQSSFYYGDGRWRFKFPYSPYKNQYIGSQGTLLTYSALLM